ncbi:MAG TPA: hypothetical protein VLM79_08650 [Kofleriaceae bacterium]|nr:hypothetical protein [Kofleriaceae bacterium]
MMTGCVIADPTYRPPGASSGDADAGAGADAPSDVGAPCYGPPPFTVCFATAPTRMIKVDTDTTFNTDTESSVGTQLTCATPMSGGTGYCVLAAETIIISAHLRAEGHKPLFLVAADSIEVSTSAFIDVGSHRLPTESRGAGARSEEVCTYGEEAGFGGGGAGGSFLGRGGAGGNGGGVAGGGKPGDPSSPPTTLLGGCPGKNGIGRTFSADLGHGGLGGGAVYLIARNSITVTGDIDAGGEGGSGAGNKDGGELGAGGGGGGAGGMIGLHAGSITVTGALIANGGGGGESSGAVMGTTGAGADAVTTRAAAGGDTDTGAANGGNGSAGAANGLGSRGGDSNDGGGGGGGGAGVIMAPAWANLGSNVSPARAM